MKNWESVGHGVEARKHPTRKHGVRSDRYFRGRYTLNGKTTTVAFGWESEGWTPTRCIAELSELKTAARGGDGPTTLKEKQRLAEERRKVEEEARQEAEREGLTLDKLFEDHYLPQAKMDKSSWDRDAQLYRDWMRPVAGEKPLVAVAAFDVERIKKNMADAGKSARTIEYMLAVMRHIFNYARAHNLFRGDNPVLQVKKPRPNNRRVRFLSVEEAERLLDALREKSEQLYRISAVSLYCGLRFGEIANLTWADVDARLGSIFIRDPKNKASRTVFMPARIREMFRSMQQQPGLGFVFPSRKGGKIEQASKVFFRTVEELGLNDGVDDPRQQVCFHTLRHTFCSWLAMEGVPMATLKELTGHKSLTMVERYSHLSPHSLKAAVSLLDKQALEEQRN